jgi:predicted transposase/invertase (TIGR01784 family)
VLNILSPPIKQGIEKGKLEGKLELAKRMLLANLDIQQISEITGFSIKELEEL